MARRRSAKTLAFARPMAVDVRRLDDVGIDDGQAADASTGDELGSEATDTAQSYDEDVALSQLGSTLVTEEQACTFGPRLGGYLWCVGHSHWMPRSLSAC